MTSLSRRRFLQAAVAASAVGATIPRWMMPAGALPLASDEGMLLVVNLGGGLDSLSLLVPSDGARRSAYEAARGSEALAAGSLPPATVDHGFNPSLTHLSNRFSAGGVALVDGIGLPESLRSHSLSTAAVQSASLTPIPTGWLGRHLDGYSDRGDELMSVAVSSTVPLHVRGDVNQAAAMPPGTGMWGTDPNNRVDQTTADAVRAFSNSPADHGPWADLIAATGERALDKASLSVGLPTSSTAPRGIRQDMEIAAHVFNADIGTRVVAVGAGGYDTHGSQNTKTAHLLGELDQAIEGFFATLASDRHNRVMVLVVSEFGRKPGLTSSLGSDHGYAGISMLIGPNVAGGLHSESPSLTNLDAQDCMIPTIDLRSLYAPVLDGWLGGDSNAVLGGTYSPLGVIAASPGTNK